MLRLYMHQASSRLACRDIQRIQRIQRIQLYSYTRYTAYSTIQPPSAARAAARECRERAEIFASGCVKKIEFLCNTQLTQR